MMLTQPQRVNGLYRLACSDGPALVRGRPSPRFAASRRFNRKVHAAPPANDSSEVTVALASAEEPLLDDPTLGPTAPLPAAAPTGPNTAAAAAAAPTSAESAWRWEESDDAVLAYGSLVGLLALGNWTALHSIKLADLPYFVGLAVVTIYIGAHRGLTSRQRQQITLKEGALAPVLASVSLFGFYLLIKYLPDFNPKIFFDAYFWLLGSFAIGGAAIPVLRKVGGPLGKPSLKFDVPAGLLLDDKGDSITKAELAPTDVLAVALALGLSTAELASGHSNFTLNNLVATLVATDILQLIGPRSFRTAGLLLAGLLLYDVFWVFGSPKVVGDNVMLAVATSDVISGPTRILFPRVPGGGSTAEAAAAAFPFSLLGLGDIAVPGLLACLALRYDASRSTDMYARAVAAAEAITSAIATMQPGATGRQIADTTADAAEAAYDRVADQEARQRTESLDGGRATSRAAEAAAAASNLGASIMRSVSSANSSVAVDGLRPARGGAGNSGRSPQSNPSPPSPSSSTSSSETSLPSSGRGFGVLGGGASSSGDQQADTEASQPRLPVSEAVMYQRMYFTPIMFAYVAGLLGAFVANDVTGLGQPALLYIVPATLGAVLLTALQRGEVGRLWNFTDVPSYGLPSSEGGNADRKDAGNSALN